MACCGLVVNMVLNTIFMSRMVYHIQQRNYGFIRGKNQVFSETMKWLSIDGKYIPDLYHTILHLLIITALVSTLIYIVKNKKGKQI